MPTVQGRVRSVGVQDSKLYVNLELNEKAPRVGELVVVKWGPKRTVAQNALYWKYLRWLIDEGGLKDHGHFDPQALHENLKAHFLAEKVMDRGQFKPIESGTTAVLGKSEFSEYFKLCDMFVQDFFGVSTQAFWDDYKTNWSLE